MGKVKDDVPASSSKPNKPATKASPAKSSGWLAGFLAALTTAEPYKPNQGWHARLWTGLGLGLLLGVGIWRIYEASDAWPTAAKLLVPAGLGAGIGWVIYRLVNYPPFAEFLIATEAEMRKVSWISWPDLKRATAVVLVTVTLMMVFLFGVDYLWQALLQLIGVLKYTHSGFGSTA